MVFDIEKAQEERQALKEKRREKKLIETSENPLKQEEEHVFSVLIYLSAEEDFRTVDNIKANSPKEAFSEALRRVGLLKSKVIEKECRIRDTGTKDLYDHMGTKID